MRATLAEREGTAIRLAIAKRRIGPATIGDASVFRGDSMARRHLASAVAVALLAVGAFAEETTNAPALRVGTPLDAGTTIKTATRSARLVRELRITSSAKEAVQLRAEAGPVLRTSDGVVVGDVTWTLGGKDCAALEAEPLTLEPGRTAILHLEADLPGDGEYVIPGALTHGKTPETFRVLVTRARTVAPVEIQAIETVRATTPVRGATEAHLPLALKETSGQETSLYHPALVSLTVKDGTSRLTGSWKTFRVESAPCVTWERVVLPSNDTCVVRAVIEGLSEAGEYEGVVRVSSADATPVDAKFVLFVKRPWWLAAVVILAGAAISLALRTWLRKGRPAAVARRDLLLVDVQLESLRRNEPDRVARVAKLIRTRLAALDRQIRSGAAIDTAAITALGETARILVEAADLQADISSADRSLRADAQDAVDKVLTSLEAGKPPAGTELTDLAQARGALETKQRSWLAEQANALKEGAEALSDGDPELVRRVVHDADEAAASAAEGRLREASAAFARARRWAFVLRASTYDAAPPAGMNGPEQTEYVVISKRLSAALQAATGSAGADVSALEQALADYLGLATRVLERRVQEGAVTPPPPDPAATLRALAGVRARLAGDEVVDAEAGYRAALATLGPTPKPLRAALDLSIAPPSVPEQRDPAAVLRRVGLSMRLRDGFANATLFALAVVSGLYTVWVPDPKWGSTASVLLAFLWGAGLREIGGAAFESIDAARQRYTQDAKAVVGK
jgi:hypothetical protein